MAEPTKTARTDPERLAAAIVMLKDSCYRRCAPPHPFDQCPAFRYWKEALAASPTATEEDVR